jgi:pyruvate dehydrogenase E1 component alpha subunit
MDLHELSGGVADDLTFTAEDELAAYRAMLLIRRFEEKAGQLFALGTIHGFCHLAIGQEAAIVGMRMAARPGDQVITGHRTHGHMLAQGIEPRRIMAELAGKSSGVSKGKGGSIHMVSREHQFFGGHRILGAAAALGAGLAFASKYRDSRQVCLCSFGDGAANKGGVYETFKIAAEWKLPIVFVIDNNTAAPGTGIALGTVPSALAERGMCFAIPGEQVDGIDVRRVRAAGRRAIERARSGEGPMLLEMLTYRYRSHSAPPSGKPGSAERPRAETDPVAKSRARIRDNHVASEARLKAIEAEVRETVNAAATFARADTPPEVSALHAGVMP